MLGKNLQGPNQHNIYLRVCDLVKISSQIVRLLESHMFFHALTFAGSRGSCLNTRPLGQVFKQHQRDPASVNAMKQTCVIIILAYFT